MGVSALATSPRLVPFKLHCVRLLNQLAASSNTYVPTASLLLDVLKLGDLHKKPKPATDLPPRLDELLRFDASGVATRHQQDAVFNAATELLAQTLDVYKYNAAFPELAAPVSHALGKLAKETGIGRWRAVLKGQLDSAAKQSLWVAQKRAALVGGPGGLASASAATASSQLETFRPAGHPSARQRLEAAAAERARARAVEVASDVAKGKYKGPKPTFPKGGPRRDDGAAEDDGSGAEEEEKEEKPRGKKKAKKQKKERSATSSGLVASADGDDEVRDGFDWSDEDE
jgi:nucleolar complex protein 2